MKSYVARMTMLVVALGGISLQTAMAQDMTIQIRNLTQGIYFTPLIVAAHDANSRIFIPGSSASANLQALAEGGDISGIAADLQAVNANKVENPASGLMAPGMGISFNLNNQAGNSRLSLAAMMLPTNDGFIGLDSLILPTTPGTYRYFINAYDAGTEANNEVINGGGAPGTLGIPADPGAKNGSGGTGIASVENNPTIHIHPGNLGDDNPAGGKSDLDAGIHRWLNPVAELTITIN